MLARKVTSWDLGFVVARFLVLGVSSVFSAAATDSFSKVASSRRQGDGTPQRQGDWGCNRGSVAEALVFTRGL